MKKLLLTSTALLMIYVSKGQNTAWSTTPGALIGINTTTPIDKLEVAGGIHTSGTAAASRASEAYFDYFNGGSRIGVLGSTTSANGTFRINTFRSDASNFLIPFFIDGSGNVGIGTTTPTRSLSLQNASTNTYMSFNNGGSEKWAIGDEGTVGDRFVIYGGATPNYRLAILNSGNVGIGTVSPSTALQLGDFSNGSASNQLLIPGTYNFEQMRLGQTGNGNTALEFVNHVSTASSYGIKFLVNVDSGFPGLQLQYAAPSTTYAGLSYTTGFCMNTSGNVGIGTTNPNGYRLAVQGNVHAQQVTIDVTNWPDYVFKEKYGLTPLSDLKTYIDQNHHLPEMPSEQQIAKDGLNLGEMNKLLVKKVEELTLYLIEKDKQLNEQDERIKRIENELQTIVKTKN